MYGLIRLPIVWPRQGRPVTGSMIAGIGADGYAAFLRGASPGTLATVRAGPGSGRSRLAAVPCWVLVNRWLCQEFGIIVAWVAAAARDSLARTGR
jgi:hypothetical protein